MAIRKAAGMRAKRGKPGPGGAGSTPGAPGVKLRGAGRGRQLGIRDRGISPIENTGSVYTPPPAGPAQEATLTETGPESGGTTPGPDTPPTTYGTDPFENYGLPGGLPNGDGTMSTADMTEPGGGKPPKPPGQVKKVGGPKPGSPAAKKKLLKRVARTTGTTVGEAKGVMRKARRQVRRGNTAGARKTISRALSGGPKAGVAGSPKRARKADVAAKKITKRIQTRQAAAPKRKRK
jgi:hypothetical protein